MGSPRSFEEVELTGLHGSITPVDVREGDRISARVISVDPSFQLDQAMRVWRLSPLGIELLAQDETIIPKGTMIDLELQIGLQKTILSGLVVDDIASDSKRSYIHIRLIPRVKPRIESIERRRSTRWICSDEFYPTAVASNPARFNEFIYFRIRDISSNGLKVQTSLRNKFIIPGMTFDCIVNFPMVSQIKMKFVVKTVRIELDYGKEVLAVGVTYIADKFITESVGQYLMQFGSVNSLQELRKEGFSVESVAQAIQFSYVRTKEDYDRVLQLRFQAYKYAGKLKEGAKPIDMADSFDSRARIVIGKYKGEVVASARLIFNQFEDKMEQESFVKWPADLPRRDEMVEIMRACTHPDFRKSNLLMSLFRFIAITVTQSKRKWIVICATDDMVDLYKKIGFHEVGLDYLHSGLNNLKHNIMLANVPHAMEGRTVGLIAWNLIWSDVSSYLQEYEISEMDPITNIRLAIYRFLSPLAKLLYYMQKKLKQV